MLLVGCPGTNELICTEPSKHAEWARAVVVEEAGTEKVFLRERRGLLLGTTTYIILRKLKL